MQPREAPYGVSFLGSGLSLVATPGKCGVLQWCQSDRWHSDQPPQVSVWPLRSRFRPTNILHFGCAAV